MTTYDRPMKATLYVHLENGDQWEVGVADLEKFNLVDRHDAYMAFDDALTRILSTAGLINRDVTDAHLNPVRYLVETAVAHPDLLDHPDHHGWQPVAEAERILALADKVAAEFIGNQRGADLRELWTDLHNALVPLARVIADRDADTSD